MIAPALRRPTSHLIVAQSLIARIGLIWAAILLALAPAASVSAEEIHFPELTGRVVDEAGVLPADQKAELSQRLKALEEKNGRQLVVVTLKSLQGQEISDYGYQLGRHWGIGQKGQNNGVLLIVAPEEHKVRIEVGYGLEPILTDALSSNIIQTKILPKFRAGDVPGCTAAAGCPSSAQRFAHRRPVHPVLRVHCRVVDIPAGRRRRLVLAAGDPELPRARRAR